MISTKDQRLDFGTHLRALRKGRGLSIEEIQDRLADKGVEVSDRAITAWERGAYAPRAIDTVRYLELMLDAPGELASRLGVQHGAWSRRRGGGMSAIEGQPTLEEALPLPEDWATATDHRLEELESGIAQIRSESTEMLDLLRRLAEAAGIDTPPAPASRRPSRARGR